MSGPITQDRGELRDTVDRAHVEVATELHGRPIETFTCREIPLAKLRSAAA